MDSLSVAELSLPERSLPELSLADRELSCPELEALVDALAAQPQLWQEEVAFPAGQRHFVSLRRDEFIDVWLLCWTPGDDTGWHDHDLSSGAVRVVRGELSEASPRIGADAVSREVPAGETFSFGPDHIHRLCGRAARSVSIHAYSPPLWRLGQYTIDDRGVMHRSSVSYAEELRPAAA